MEWQSFEICSNPAETTPEECFVHRNLFPIHLSMQIISYFRFSLSPGLASVRLTHLFQKQMRHPALQHQLGLTIDQWYFQGQRKLQQNKSQCPNESGTDSTTVAQNNPTKKLKLVKTWADQDILSNLENPNTLRTTIIITSCIVIMRPVPPRRRQ